MFNKMAMDFINFVYIHTGNYGWSLILLALIIKLILYIPTQRQFESMKNMQKIQPKMSAIQEKYKDNPEKMNKEIMNLYRENNVNPMSGCLPMLIQLPILWGIWNTIMSYQDLFERSYFLWMGTPLSYKYPEIFGKSLAGQDLLILLIYGFTMYLTQKASTPPGDSKTAASQSMMGTFITVFFTYMMWQWKFPSALMIYWLVFNIFSIIQQMLIMRKDENPVPIKVQKNSI